MDEKIDLLIDRYNTMKAQNLALTHALAGLLSLFPEEDRAKIAKHFDMRCATFQAVINDGRTELDALAIQRKQFADMRKKIFQLP